MRLSVMLHASIVALFFVGFAAGQTYTSCGITNTLTQTPSRVVTLNQGVTEFMLAMGLESKMVGTAYLDDDIWPRYKTAYDAIPVLEERNYPTEVCTHTHTHARAHTCARVHMRTGGILIQSAAREYLSICTLTGAGAHATN